MLQVEREMAADNKMLGNFDLVALTSFTFRTWRVDVVDAFFEM